MSPDVYLIYHLILKHGLTVDEIYSACKGRPTRKFPRREAPFGTQRFPLYYRPYDKSWYMCYILSRSGVSGLYAHSKHYSRSCLGRFIVRYATEKVKLTKLDRLTRKAIKWFL